MLLATHSGPFHADDVFACALVRTFVDADVEVIRSRDPERLNGADIVVDVGGLFDPESRRFDHHQRAYTGARSSAGMVLDWLQSEGHVSEGLAEKIRRKWVDYIDDVDNGRRSPDPEVPCLPSVIEALCEQAVGAKDFDARYLEAVGMCAGVLRGLVAAERRSEEARGILAEAMKAAEAAGSRVMRVSETIQWKRAYFELGGAEHPTDFLVMPDQGAWRILAIPVAPNTFENKRDLPAPWAGLEGEALSEVVGVPGARFCHKNLFISVFESQQSAEQAIARWKLEAPA